MLLHFWRPLSLPCTYHKPASSPAAEQCRRSSLHLPVPSSSPSAHSGPSDWLPRAISARDKHRLHPALPSASRSSPSAFPASQRVPLCSLRLPPAPPPPAPLP